MHQYSLTAQLRTTEDQTAKTLLKLQKVLAGLALGVAGVDLLPYLMGSAVTLLPQSVFPVPVDSSITGESILAVGGITAAAVSLLVGSARFNRWLAVGILLACLNVFFRALPVVESLENVFVTNYSSFGQNQQHYWTLGTAFCLALFGLSLLMPTYKATSVLTYGVLLVSYVALVAYIMGKATFPGIAAYALLPPLRAFAFLCLSVAVLVGHPWQGVARLFSSEYAGSRHGKRAFTGIFVSPILLALLVAFLRHHAGFTAESGLVLFFLIYLIASLLGAYMSFSQLNAYDAARLKLLEQNQGINQQLTRVNLDLKQANEEMATLTEELTATNEELTATMEELQVTNEQLAGANQEIQSLMEWKLSQSELKFKELTESITDLFLAVDNQLQYVYWNRACESTFGLASTDVIGRSMLDIIPQFLGSHYEREFREALLTREPLAFEYWNTHGQKRRYLQVAVYPSHLGLSVLIKDVTETKQKEQQIVDLNQTLLQQNQVLDQRNTELQLRNQELDQRNFELDQIVYKISHDIRSPLTSILGLVNLMRLQPLEADLAEYVQLMENRVKKLDHFTQSMLDYSRTTRTALSTQAVDITQLLDSCLAELEFMPHFERLKFCFSVEGTPLYSDSFRLQVIFSNLLGNAVKYQFLERAQSYVNVFFVVDQHEARVTIEDNGIGIEEKYLPRIFDMFFRASEQSTGSGLGMYIVKQTVEKLGGSISLRSTLGEGTCIELIIPNATANTFTDGREAFAHL